MIFILTFLKKNHRKQITVWSPWMESVFDFQFINEIKIENIVSFDFLPIFNFHTVNVLV